MLTILKCPLCGGNLSADAKITITTPTYYDKNRSIRGHSKLEDVQLRAIEPLETTVARILIRIQSYIYPGMAIDELSEVLEDEYRVCPAHIPMMIERIKEGYGLYSPDGKVLEKIS